ncbi:MAG: hypothetical protein AB1782_16915 [Cyanobacteriota bacterium]
MKIFIDYIRNENEEMLTEDLIDDVIHEVICTFDGCNGKINFFSRQIDDGSAVICNKCKRAVIVKQYEI